MSIDIAAFTPGSAALGGLIIGLAVSALLLLNGRIAGISGILANTFSPHSGWRIAFIAGLIISPWAYFWFIALYREMLTLSSGKSSRYPGIHKPSVLLP